MTNIRSAWMCGERAGHNGLRAWVRGTQSLIARFQSRYEVAYDALQAGLEYATAMIPAVVAVGSDPVRHWRDAWLWTCRPAVATVFVSRAVVARV
jgi:hypothetical protein